MSPSRTVYNLMPSVVLETTRKSSFVVPNPLPDTRLLIASPTMLRLLSLRLLTEGLSTTVGVR